MIELVSNGRKIKLTTVAASGAFNFFGPGTGPGHGWWYHKYLKLLFGKSFDYSRLSAFITKTTTLNEREGNLKLDKKTLQPVKWFPDCVRINWIKGIMLNAVGLSGPGLENLLSRRQWQLLTKPFGISFMAVGDTLEEMKEEAREFVFKMRAALPNFLAPIFVELNVSCPNQKHDPKELENKILTLLEITQTLGVPVIVKINALVETDIVREIEKSRLCAAISISNTIPWGQLPEKIDWQKLFGSVISPLHKYGGGGLSGPPLVPIVCGKIREFRDAGINLQILGGGGIGCRTSEWLKKEIQEYKNAGADAVQYGTSFPVRPMLVREDVLLGNKTFGGVKC